MAASLNIWYIPLIFDNVWQIGRTTETYLLTDFFVKQTTFYTGATRTQDLNSAARATRLVRKFSLKFLEGRCLFSQDTIQDEQSPKLAETFSNKSHPRDKTGKKLISRDFLASDCRQQLFDHDSCESGSAGSSLPLSSIFDRLELYIAWIRKLCSLQVSSNLQKNKDFCVFSSTTWNRYTVISFYIYSPQKQNSRSRTATTTFRSEQSETQTCGNRTTPRLLRDLLNFSWQRVDSNQLKIINGKKRFSLITLLRINLFS